MFCEFSVDRERNERKRGITLQFWLAEGGSRGDGLCDEDVVVRGRGCASDFDVVFHFRICIFLMKKVELLICS